MAHQVYVGAETGLIKGIEVNKNKWINLNEVAQVSRSNEITVMCWQDEQEQSMLYGIKSGLLKSFSIEDQAERDILQVTSSDGEVIKGAFKYENKYITCTNTGTLCIWDENDDGDAPLEEAPRTSVSIDCGKDIYCMKQDVSCYTHVATGGKNNDLKIHDITRPDAGAIFRAKNVRDDWLDLQCPIWVTDIEYIRRATSSLIVACTGHHQIRIYDPSTHQRRPMIDLPWGENPLTSLCVSNHNDRQVIVGNSIGEQGIIDLRTKQCLGKFKGGAGSIRCIRCHPSKNIVVSCGLDRYARIHDLSTRILTHKFYLKSRLNSLLLTSTWVDEEDEINGETPVENSNVAPSPPQEDENDDDDLWNELDTVEDGVQHGKTQNKLSNSKKILAPKKKSRKRKKGPNGTTKT